MYCNQQLEWYKSVKEAQGSVEVTSFGKMRNILAYGRYKVGSNNTQTVHSIHDMIHLKLENTGKQLHKTSFSLDDLRDLHWKQGRGQKGGGSVHQCEGQRNILSWSSCCSQVGTYA